MVNNPMIGTTPPDPSGSPPHQLAPPNMVVPAGARVYISTQGDWWDMIAIRVYGRVRGNEHLMYRLLEENYPLRDVSNFPAGVPVIVPAIAVTTTIPLVPWTDATFIPTP